MYIRWYIFYCDLVRLYRPLHFLSLWLSGIFAITNSNSDSASLWKIPHWILTSAKPFPPVSSTFQVFMIFSINCMASSNIFYILGLFIILLCRTISNEFLKSIHAIAKFLRHILLSLRMYWLIYSSSLVPLVPLLHPFCSSWNNTRLINA